MKFSFDADAEVSKLLRKEYRKLGFKCCQRKQTYTFSCKTSGLHRFTVTYAPLFRQIQGSFILAVESTHPQHYQITGVFEFCVYPQPD